MAATAKTANAKSKQKGDIGTVQATTERTASTRVQKDGAKPLKIAGSATQEATAGSGKSGPSQQGDERHQR